MANNYSQFSEAICKITPEERDWINLVLHLDVEEDEEREQLYQALGLDGSKEQLPTADELECWPQFEWSLDSEGDLWLYSDEGANLEHLEYFVGAFIRKFRPDYIFKATGSETCSKPRIGEFGGWWLVISRDKVQGGNTWDAATEAAKKIQGE